jgi:hypothetical protein
MIPSKSTEKQQHGQYTLHRALRTVSNQDGWLESLGEVGKTLKVWRDSLIAELRGEATISAMQWSIIELATKTHLEQPSLVNKSKR